MDAEERARLRAAADSAQADASRYGATYVQADRLLRLLAALDAAEARVAALEADNNRLVYIQGILSAALAARELQP